MSVMVVTSVGDVVIDLHTDRCPLTTKNFLKLCKIKYFNGCLFHTVQKDFIAQAGDPTGKGAGGDSIYKFLYGDQARFFGDEIHPDLKHSKTGTVAMASSGENLNASQFYFTLRDDLDYLDGKHTVFGEVAEGLDTLTRINEAYVDEKERPYKNIRIKHTYILDDPFDDPSQLAELIPDASPEGKPADEIDDDVRLEDDWVPLDEQLAPSELEEMIRAKAAHSSAVVLESIGDIPEAEIKPPENVLFVCKLNPVTEDEDLNTIFSRFGNVVSADIIRDFKTGDSLCYAFIEFETVEACEQAYFKMDNALIDDRRIKVDFSQSVAKLWSQYRQKGTQGAKGRGCFKCGALDHIAKDCSGGPVNAGQPPKYIIKEFSKGDANSRYDMVFEGDTHLSSENGELPEDNREKWSRDMRSTRDLRQRDHKRDPDYKYARDEKRRGYKEDGMRHEGRRAERRLDDDESLHDYKKREGYQKVERRGDKREEREDYRAHNDGHVDKEKSNTYRKAERHIDRRDKRDYRAHSIGQGEKEKSDIYRKSESHRDRRYERDYREQIDGHADKKQEQDSRKRSAHSDLDRDYRKYRGEKLR